MNYPEFASHKLKHISPVEQYATAEGLNIHELTTQLPATPSVFNRFKDKLAQESIKLDSLVPELWWKSRDFFRKRIDPHGKITSIKPWEKPDSTKTSKQQLLTYLDEVATPVAEQTLNNLQQLANQHSRPEAQTLSQAITDHLQLAKQNHEQFANQLAWTHISSWALNTYRYLNIFLISTGRQIIIPAISPLGIALAERHAHHVTKAYDPMNIDLRNLYPLGAITYQSLNYTDPFQKPETRAQAREQFHNVRSAEPEILLLYRQLVDQELNTHTQSAVTASICGALLGDYGIGLATTIGSIATEKLLQRAHNRNQTEFLFRFEGSKARVLGLAETATYDFNPQRLQVCYQESQDIAQQVNSQANGPSQRIQQITPIAVQDGQSSIAVLTENQPNPFGLILASARATQFKIEAEQGYSSRAARQNLARIQLNVQNLYQTQLLEYQAQCQSVSGQMETATQAYQANIRISSDNQWSVAGYPSNNHGKWEFKSTPDLEISPGINLIEGEIGSGKSLLIRYLLGYCQEQQLPYGLSQLPNHHNIYLECSSRLLSGQGDNLLTFLNAQAYNIEANYLTAQQRNVLWQALGENCLNTFTLWRNYHIADTIYGQDSIAPEIINILDKLTYQYFANQGVTSPNAMRGHASAGNAKIIGMNLALINPHAKIRFFDETFTNLDPLALNQSIDRVVSKQSQESHVPYLIVTHDPLVREAIITRTPSQVALIGHYIEQQGYRQIKLRDTSDQQVQIRPEVGDRLSLAANMRKIQEIENRALRLISTPGCNTYAAEFAEFTGLIDQLEELKTMTSLPEITQRLKQLISTVIIQTMSQSLTERQRHLITGMFNIGHKLSDPEMRREIINHWVSSIPHRNDVEIFYDDLDDDIQINLQEKVTC